MTDRTPLIAEAEAALETLGAAAVQVTPLAFALAQVTPLVFALAQVTPLVFALAQVTPLVFALAQAQAELADLQQQNDAAPAWGAAVGARQDRIAGLQSEIRRIETILAAIGGSRG